MLMFKRKHPDRELEGILRMNRPEPKAELIERLTQSVHADATVGVSRGRRLQIAFAGPTQKAPPATGLKDLSRYFAALVFEPTNPTFPGTYWLCHSDDGIHYDNGSTGRLSASNQSDYTALRNAHMHDHFDEGFFSD